MPRGFFDPTPEQQNVVLIRVGTLRQAERRIESCEHCTPEGAEIPFDHILDCVTGSDPSVTDYILETPAKCPNCRRDINEKTLGACKGRDVLQSRLWIDSQDRAPMGIHLQI